MAAGSISVLDEADLGGLGASRHQLTVDRKRRAGGQVEALLHGQPAVRPPRPAGQRRRQHHALLAHLDVARGDADHAPDEEVQQDDEADLEDEQQLVNQGAART